MWLFLSTECMLLAALASAWVIMRWSAGAAWPALEDMHVSWWWGAILTLVLLASGWTAARAGRAGQGQSSGAARAWIVVTLLLATLFLAVKGLDWSDKWRSGLIRLDGRPAVRDRADELYVAAVAEELRSGSGNAAGPNALGQDEARRDLMRQIRSGLVEWTARQVGRSGDAASNGQRMQALAEMIHPTTASAWAREYLLGEQGELSARRQELASEQQADQERLGELQAAMRGTGAGGERPADSVRREAASLTASLTEQKSRLVELDDRLAALARFVPVMERGLNAEFGLRLPVVIPGGGQWISGSFLLSGMHALHMVAGMVAWGALLVLRSGPGWVAAVGNVALYWQFVDLMWVVIFVLVYCLN